MTGRPEDVKCLQRPVRGSSRRVVDGRLFRRMRGWLVSDNEDNQERAYHYAGELPFSMLPNRVKEIDWHIEENSKIHHTELFEVLQDENCENVIVRRGQPIRLSIRFMYRNFNLRKDRITLEFTFGHDQPVTKGFKVSLVVKGFQLEYEADWAVRIKKAKGKTLCLEVFIAPEAFVGVWKLSVTSALVGEAATTRKRDNRTLYILFNPWCTEDTVYFEDEKLLEEYVLNDSGKIYTGTYQSPRGRSWSFGQFDRSVLSTVMCILELLNIEKPDRGNAVKMARAISSVNSQVSNSLMKERTDGNYDNGTAPCAWTSSVDILDCYLVGYHHPVKYGQCWVFSAVATTIFRALGIPCRSVSSFASARETNSSLEADKAFDVRGDEVYAGTDAPALDSVWCFHAWNDVWMARPDLEGDYGGWQVIDATPKECESAGHCGPAPLAAVRRGKVELAYDTDFVFTEVNSAIAYWGEDEEAGWGFSLIKKDKHRVGQLIVTKDPKKDGNEEDEEDYEVILEDYVDPERGQAQLKEVRTKTRGGGPELQENLVNKDSKKDVEFKLQGVKVLESGQNICVTLAMKNTSTRICTVNTNFTVNAIFYTGEFFGNIGKWKEPMTLNPGSSLNVILRAPFHENWRLLREFSIVRVLSVCSVQETKQRWCQEEDFDIKKPRLRIQFQEEVCKVDKPYKVEFSFTNPLPVFLTGCQLRVTDPERTSQRIVHVIRDVPARGDFVCRLSFVPRKPGGASVTASFISNELYEVTGSKTIIVK